MDVIRKIGSFCKFFPAGDAWRSAASAFVMTTAIVSITSSPPADVPIPLTAEETQVVSTFGGS
jgi:hypothetical protein